MRIVADGRAHFAEWFRRVSNHKIMNMYRERARRAVFFLDKDLHGSSDVSRVSTIDLLVIPTLRI